MYRQLVKTAIIGGLGLFFLLVFGTFGYFLISTAGKTSLSVTLSMLVIFIIFVVVGFLISLRSARMVTGDAKRISEYAFSSKDLSIQSNPSVKSPEQTETQSTEATSADEAIDSTEDSAGDDDN